MTDPKLEVDGESDANPEDGSAVGPLRLRSRGDVDSQIAFEIRSWRKAVAEGSRHTMTLNYITVERLQELCDEPCAPTLPRSTDALDEAELAHVWAISNSSRLHHFEARPLQKLLRAYQALSAPSPAPCSGCEALSRAIDSAIRDMLSGGHPFEKGVAKAINDLRAAQKERP